MPRAADRGRQQRHRPQLRSDESGRQRAVRTALDFQRRIGELQLAQSQSCPSIFTIKSAHRRIHVNSKFQIRLFCEQPGKWHPLEDAAGVITLTRQPEWLESFNPYLRVLLRLIPLVGPALDVVGQAVAGPSSPNDRIEELWRSNQIDEELNGMRQLIEALPQRSDLAVEHEAADLADIDDISLYKLSSPASFQAFRRTLEAAAPRGTDPWYGLTPIITPEGLPIFVCGEHAREYAYPRLLDQDGGSPSSV